MRKKIILLVGIIVISSFSIGYITSLLISNSTPNGDTPNGDTPKFYSAIDNMWLTTGTGNTGEPRPVSSTLRGGMTQTQTASTDYHEIYIRFSLIDKPNNWNKVEVSLYKYSFYKQYNAPTIWVDLFEGNWTEEYITNEIYWDLKNRFGSGFTSILGYSIGFHRVDITDFIKGYNGTTFSIHISTGQPNRNDGTIVLYSNRWDGGEPYLPYVLPENDSYKNYLPQLIWS